MLRYKRESVTSSFWKRGRGGFMLRSKCPSEHLEQCGVRDYLNLNELQASCKSWLYNVCGF